MNTFNVKNFNFKSFKNKYILNRLAVYIYVLILLLSVQFFFWKTITNVRAFLDVVPIPPSEKTVKAFSFGDEEFYFRTKLFKVQNMGDTLGRFTSLKKYDYSKLYNWFIVLEKLNSKSMYLPSLAAYYFSQTPNKDDKIYMVNFLKGYALLNPEKNWWWLYQSVYIAFYGMNNKELGIELAYKLKEVSPETAPLWTKQMVAILLSKKGDDCESVRVISEILNDYENNKDKTEEEKEVELNYMKYFIEKKINILNSKHINVNNCFK